MIILPDFRDEIPIGDPNTVMAILAIDNTSTSIA